MRRYPWDGQKIQYFLKQAFLRGVTSGGQESFIGLRTMKSPAAAIAYTAALHVLLVGNYYLFVRYLIKDCDHLAKLLDHCGAKLVCERTL